MYFQKYGLQKTWSEKCLKSSVSEHRWTVNMLKRPKHCQNPYGSTFITFSYNSEGKRVGKCLS